MYRPIALSDGVSGESMTVHQPVRRPDAIFDGPPISQINGSAPAPRRTSRPAGPSPAFRPDIQGLRACAVLLVVANHATGHPVGGFIGVDVFFVISGFLITGVLLKGNATHGRVSFSRFYKARARRILPASLVVLASCWIVSHLVFNGVRVRQNTSDILWALGFSANIHFERIGTNYFQDKQAPSLVQHYWSLAVEEQFYVVWPVVILVVLTGTAIAVKSSRARLLLLTVVITGASLASLVYAWSHTQTDPTAAYFSTVDRAWELGVGAALAVAVARFPRIVQRLGAARGPLSLLGVALIAASAFVVTPTPGFPVPGAILPVLATALVLLAGTSGSPGRWAGVLTNPISVYIGLVSYSLYLWHWPVIVVGDALLPHRTALFYLMTAAATAALTIFSYHFIESPFRDRSFRQAVEQRSTDPVARSRILLIAAVAALFATVCYTFKPDPVVPDFTATPISVTAARTAVASNIAVPPASLTRDITSALSATRFPNLQPDLDHLGLTPAETDWKGCNADSSILRTCTFRPTGGTASPKRVALVLGDSIALSWLPAIREALQPRGWTIYGLARQQCSSAAAPQIALQSGLATGCDRLHAFYPRAVRLIKPSLIIMSNSESAPNRLKDRARGAAAQSEYAQALIRTIHIFAGGGRKIVNLSAPPTSKALLDCDTASAAPADCVGKINSTWRAQSTSNSAIANETGTTYVDTHRWFCNDGSYCPAFVGNTPVRYDDEHITKDYAKTLSVPLAAVLTVSA